MGLTDGYHVDSGGGKSGINDDLLPRPGITNERLCLPVLFSDHGRDIGLEATSAKTHDDDGNDEAGK